MKVCGTAQINIQSRSRKAKNMQMKYFRLALYVEEAGGYSKERGSGENTKWTEKHSQLRDGEGDNLC